MLDTIESHGLAALENPATAYRTCVEVLEALGEEAAAREALESGRQAWMEKADSIDWPEIDQLPEKNRYQIYSIGGLYASLYGDFHSAFALANI